MYQGYFFILEITSLILIYKIPIPINNFNNAIYHFYNNHLLYFNLLFQII